MNDRFERHRVRGYARVLTFALLVDLIADAPLQHEGSGRQSFVQARETGNVAASVPAADEPSAVTSAPTPTSIPYGGSRPTYCPAAQL